MKALLGILLALSAATASVNTCDLASRTLDTSYKFQVWSCPSGIAGKVSPVGIAAYVLPLAATHLDSVLVAGTHAVSFTTGDFSGAVGIKTTATQNLTVLNGLNIFTGGTYSYTSATQGVNIGYDNNVEKGWIQVTREDYAHLRELMLNPGGGNVSIGPGGFSWAGGGSSTGTLCFDGSTKAVSVTVGACP